MDDLNQQSQPSQNNSNVQPNTTVASQPAAQPQSGDGQTVAFDLSQFWKEGETGVYDDAKISQVFSKMEHDKKTAETSAKYFQSQYSKAMNMKPVEKIEDYDANFVPDSRYKDHIDDTVKEKISEFNKMCFDNKIGIREANIFRDFYLNKAIDDGLFDVRTEEQKQADDARNYGEVLKACEPYFTSREISAKENDEGIIYAIEHSPVFKENGVKSAMIRLTDTTGKSVEQAANDLKLASEFVRILHSHSIQDTSVITGTPSTGDRNALLKALAESTDPAEHAELLRKYKESQQNK